MDVVFMALGSVRLVSLCLMRVTFGDDCGRVFDSLVVRWNGKVDGVDVEYVRN